MASLAMHILPGTVPLAGGEDSQTQDKFTLSIRTLEYGEVKDLVDAATTHARFAIPRHIGDDDIAKPPPSETSACGWKTSTSASGCGYLKALEQFADIRTLHPKALQARRLSWDRQSRASRADKGLSKKTVATESPRCLVIPLGRERHIMRRDFRRRRRLTTLCRLSPDTVARAVLSGPVQAVAMTEVERVEPTGYPVPAPGAAFSLPRATENGARESGMSWADTSAQLSILQCLTAQHHTYSASRSYPARPTST